MSKTSAILTLALVALLLLFGAMPLAALAQPAARNTDRGYCESLSQLYGRYVGSRQTDSGAHQPTKPNAEGDLAAASCGSSPGTAIPVLERKLRGAGIGLPPRR